jgi:hypothetical protein
MRKVHQRQPINRQKSGLYESHRPNRGGRALILTDASARRQKERSRYRTCCRNLDRTAALLRSFEEKTRPLFEQWFERELAGPLHSLRTLQRQLDEAQRTLSDVEHYAVMMQVSRLRAYQRLMEARATGQEEAYWAEAMAEQSAREARLARAADESSQSAAAFAAAFAEEFIKEFEAWSQQSPDEVDKVDEFSRNDRARQRRQETNPWHDHHGEHSKENATAESSGKGRPDTASPRSAREHLRDKSGEEYLQALYRKLVRALHPDTHDGQVAPNPQLWQQVQDAYVWGDTETLERLYRQILHGEAPALDFASMPIGDIIKLRQKVEAKLRKLRHELNEAKTHPAWDFSLAPRGRNHRDHLKRSLAAAIASDDRQMRAALSVIQRQFARWAKSATKHARKKAAANTPARPTKGPRR